MTSIHWFRRDLRVSDNPGLHAAAADEHVVPVYIVSDWQHAHDWTGAPRQEFLCGCLESLSQNIEHLGGRLIFRKGDAVGELRKLIRETGATSLHFARDYDPFGRAMEQRVEEMARAEGVAVFSHKDRVLHEANDVQTGSGTMFKVFSPYARAWLKLPKSTRTVAIKKISVPASITSQPLPGLATWGLTQTASRLPEAGERAARARLTRFLAGPVFRYGQHRNLPAGNHTSQLSIDLRHGTLSLRHIYNECLRALENADAAGRRSAQTFLNELIWREFYQAVLWHWPEVLEHEWNPRWRGLRWDHDEKIFQRWCNGETGFPIVDAAMRQLNTTGWMHNRLRMITAMFLTKDLHIDWRMGERYFMQRLVDGEIAANNGGWQWSAGTGADAAPYFRIQNPWSQTKSYDPEGEFIKEWLPELRDVPAVKLLAPPAGMRLAPGYPLPMVDHKTEREACLQRFAEVEK